MNWQTDTRRQLIPVLASIMWVKINSRNQVYSKNYKIIRM